MIGPSPEMEPPDRKMKSTLPGVVFTKPASQRTTRRSSSPPAVHLVTTVRPRRRHGARHDAAHRRGRHADAPEVDATVATPLIAARRGRRVAGARFHQARAMDADATEVGAPEVGATVSAPTHHHSMRTTHRRSSSSPSPRYGRRRRRGRCPGGRRHGVRPHSSPLDEDDASPELVFTKPTLRTLTPPSSMPRRSMPWRPTPLITTR
ncbi:hypothetical protein VPH35_075729 [Triticum aestivum]